MGHGSSMLVKGWGSLDVPSDEGRIGGYVYKRKCFGWCKEKHDDSLAMFIVRHSTGPNGN